MSKEIIGTPQQYEQFCQVLEELKSVPGPVMKAMQSAQDIYGYLPIEVQSKIASTAGGSANHGGGRPQQAVGGSLWRGDLLFAV